MNNKTELSEKEGVLDLASLWISRLDRGLNAEEEAQLLDWLHDSETNAREFFQLAALWDNLSSLDKFR